MKKTLLYASVAISMALMATSCIGGGSHMVGEYYIYIMGDANRTVHISYAEREKVKNNSRDHSSDGSPNPAYSYGDDNVTTTESVTLPFFKEVHAVFDNTIFLEVTSENDTTTKAIVFTHNLFILRADSSKCWYIAGIITKDSRYPAPDCNECASCNGLTTESIMNYLKVTGYPCYLEFSQGDTLKRVKTSDNRAYNQSAYK